MSLDFDVSKIKDYENVTTFVNSEGKAVWHPVTNALVWASIPCGYWCITEKNYQTVYGRVNAWQRAVGGLITRGKIWLTLDDVEMHIGLRTNATEKTDSEFWRFIMKKFAEDNGETSAMNIIGWRGVSGIVA
jgi:hypothetical protein